MKRIDVSLESHWTVYEVVEKQTGRRAAFQIPELSVEGNCLDTGVWLWWNEAG